jgi:hypothetical protein
MYEYDDHGKFPTVCIGYGTTLPRAASATWSFLAAGTGTSTSLLRLAPEPGTGAGALCCLKGATESTMSIIGKTA